MADETIKNENRRGITFPQSMWGWILCLVFLTALTAAFSMTFYPRARAAADNASSTTPWAVPEVLAVSEVPFDDETLAFFGTLGTVRTANAGSGFTESGKRCMVLSCGYGFLSDLLTLTAGRMPQNASECVILSLSGELESVGNTVYLENSAYTVVGCAKNCRTLFSPYARKDEKLAVREDEITYTDADCILFTVGAELPGALAFVNGCRDPEAARQRAELYAAEHVSAFLAARAEADEAALSVRRAEARVLDGKIAALEEEASETERRLSVLSGQIDRTETAVLNADRALQAAIQQFRTEMERLEHHSSNEVGMIEQKEKEQKKFDAMQAEADALRDTLQALYTERELCLRDTERIAAQLAEARAAAGNMLSLGEAPDETAVTAAFRVIGSGDAGYGRAALLDAAQEEGGRLRLPALLLLFFTLAAAGLTGVFAGRGADYTVSDGAWLLLCTALVSVLGAAVGGCLLPQMRYPTVMPTIAPVTAMPLQIGDITGQLLIVCVVVTAFTCAAAGIGVLLQRQKRQY